MDARGSNLGPEKGIPASYLSPVTNLLCDHEPVLFPLWASVAPKILKIVLVFQNAVMGGLKRWPGVSLLPKEVDDAGAGS
jgi:hypothetical protein